MRSITIVAAALFAAMLVHRDGHAAPYSMPRKGSDIVQRDGGVTRRIDLGAGKSAIVDLPRAAAEVFVADPKVANAIVRSPRKLYIIAEKAGQTTIFAMDAQGRQIESINVSVGQVVVHGIDELNRILKIVIPTSNIVLHSVNDTIILTGEVDSAEDSKKAEDIAKAFVSQVNGVGTESGSAASSGSEGGGSEGQTSSQQYTSNFSFAPTSSKDKDGKIINSLTIRGRDEVMLKVTVAEVQRQVLKQLGITASYAAGNWGTWIQDNGLPLNMQKLTTGFAQFGGGNLSATLTAFERDGVARVLAEPTVTAVSGESAKFMAGGKIPTPQSETCPQPGTYYQQCQISVTYMNYGVSLNFTPVVESAGRILLHVGTEVTEIDPQQSVQFQNINVPGFRTRTNETTVELPSGGSIVSAGLIQVQSQQVMNGLPGLMNLPVLGQLFRSRDYQRNETELMIIVTPYLAKPVAPGQVALPTDGFADASDPQAALLGRINRIYATPGNPAIIRNFKGHVGFIDN